MPDNSSCWDALAHCNSTRHVTVTTLALYAALTWYTADVHSSAAFLEVGETRVDHMGFGVLANAATQSLLLRLQHGRQARVWQALHYDALH